MRWLLRRLLICLLALAVPAQGVATATMAFCGPGHHGGPASNTTPTPSTAEKHPHAAAQAQPLHEHHAMLAEPGCEGGGAAALSDPAFTSAPTDTHKCSACASCCSAAAILNLVLTVPAPERMTKVFTAVVSTVDAYAAGGPDRPPRTPLA